MKLVKHYLKLSAQLLKFRLDNPNLDDPDEILDAMDGPWYDMNLIERSYVEKELAKAMKNKTEELKFIEKYF